MRVEPSVPATPPSLAWWFHPSCHASPRNPPVAACQMPTSAADYILWTTPWPFFLSGAHNNLRRWLVKALTLPSETCTPGCLMNFLPGQKGFTVTSHWQRLEMFTEKPKLQRPSGLLWHFISWKRPAPRLWKQPACWEGTFPVALTLPRKASQVVILAGWGLWHTACGRYTACGIQCIQCIHDFCWLHHTPTSTLMFEYLLMFNCVGYFETYPELVESQWHEIHHSQVLCQWGPFVVSAFDHFYPSQKPIVASTVV